MQYFLRYLIFTTPAKHEPLNLPFWNKYYIFLLKILYCSVCLIYTILTHLKSFKLVQYSLRYLNFTLPAEHEIRKFDKNYNKLMLNGEFFWNNTLITCTCVAQQAAAGTCRYPRKSKIDIRIWHDPWELYDPDSQVHNLWVFLAGTCCEPVDHCYDFVEL